MHHCGGRQDPFLHKVKSDCNSNRPACKHQTKYQYRCYVGALQTRRSPRGGTGTAAAEGVEILEETLLGHRSPFLRNGLLELNLTHGALAFIPLIIYFVLFWFFFTEKQNCL